MYLFYTTDDNINPLNLQTLTPRKVMTELDTIKRPILHTVLKNMRAGDVLVVGRLSDLASKIEDRRAVFDAVKHKGGRLRSLKSGQEFKDFSQYLEAVEDLRDGSGVNKSAPNRKRFRGRPIVEEIGQQVIELYLQGLSCREISKQLGGRPSKATVNRLIQKYEAGLGQQTKRSA